jgi:thiosulfate oxidation carrier complex protein SoxZ
MAEPMKIRASMSGDAAEVKCLMNHPMETGLRKDAKTGAVVPAHHITNVTATLNGTQVLNAQWGGGISKSRVPRRVTKLSSTGLTTPATKTPPKPPSADWNGLGTFIPAQAGMASGN